MAFEGLVGGGLVVEGLAGGGLAGAGRPVLIVLRGNSASGKSAVAAEIRRRRGARDLAIVGQDHLRRVVLRERDEPGGANIALIGLTARFALDHGYHTIVEGILYAAHYADMLSALVSGHAGCTRCYYLDVPFDETVRRHATKPQAAEYGSAEMRSWYRERDFLPGIAEDVIPPGSTLDETVTRIMTDTGLSPAPSDGPASDSASASDPASASASAAASARTPAVRTPTPRTPTVRTPTVRTPGVRTPGAPESRADLRNIRHGVTPPTAREGP